VAQPRGQWSGKLGFILAAAGSAVGLGNLWKFPYITYDNEGGAFVLVYIVAIALVGLPIVIAEILLGRKTQRSPVGAFRILAAGKPGGRWWSALGYLGVSGGFVILSYYAVVAGWTLRYTWMALSGQLRELAAQPGALDAFFGSYVADGGAMVLGNGIFMILTISAVYFGVKSGIERVAKILMPVLFLILIGLAVYASTTSGFGEAMTFLFRPNFGDLTAHAVLEALGHSFFTLSLGMGAILTYGSYMKKENSIPIAGLQIAALDTIIALLACVVMFSIIFTFDMEVSKSAGILFTTLPTVFFQLSGGGLIAAAFYILVAFAALTSTISLLEVVSSFAIDDLGWSRKQASITMGFTIFVFGVLNALSLGANDWLTNIHPLGESHAGLFNTLDYFASNWMLPVGGLFIALFTGWVLSSKETWEELSQGHEGSAAWYAGWRFLIRFVAPIAVGAIIFSIIFLGMEYQ
jgi:NSS family neurotransmitter:Na+ symporter